jgi:hypothetical protein
VVERLLRNPVFTQVKQTKAPPKGGEVPADQQQAAPGGRRELTDAEHDPPWPNGSKRLRGHHR